MSKKRSKCNEAYRISGLYNKNVKIPYKKVKLQFLHHNLPLFTALDEKRNT